MFRPRDDSWIRVVLSRENRVAFWNENIDDSSYARNEGSGAIWRSAVELKYAAHSLWMRVSQRDLVDNNRKVLNFRLSIFSM